MSLAGACFKVVELFVLNIVFESSEWSAKRFGESLLVSCTERGRGGEDQNEDMQQ